MATEYRIRARARSSTKEIRLEIRIGRSEDGGDTFDEIASFTEHTETGDKSELPVEYSPSVWGNVSSSSEECSGNDCPRIGECYVFKARSGEGNVIVTNYHLLYSDFLIKAATMGKAGMLPDYSQ